MAQFDGQALLGQAEDLVKKALAQGADQVEVYRAFQRHVDVDIEEGRVTFAGTGTKRGGSIRLVKDGRLGFAYFVDSPEAAIGHALQAAKFAPKQDYRLPGGGSVAGLGRWNSEAANLDPDHTLRIAKDMLQAATTACPNAVVTGGGVGIGAGAEAIASSEGVAVWDAETGCSASVSLVAEDGDTAVSTWYGDQATGLVDGADIGKIAGDKLSSLLLPTPVRTGVRDIILSPDAAADLVGGLLLAAVDGDEASRGKTVWSDAIGTRVAPEGFHLLDDPTYLAGHGPAAFDGEGLAARRLPIIRDGMLETFQFDSWDAHMHRREDAGTGSSTRGGYRSPPETGSHQVVVESSRAVARDAMIASVDHGILIDSILGAHTANVTTGDFSVTAPSLWRIEKGAIAGPGDEVALSGNIQDLLMGLQAVSRERRLLGGAVMPTLHVTGIDVSVG